jgi:hypothetical protein
MYWTMNETAKSIPVCLYFKGWSRILHAYRVQRTHYSSFEDTCCCHSWTESIFQVTHPKPMLRKESPKYFPPVQNPKWQTPTPSCFYDNKSCFTAAISLSIFAFVARLNSSKSFNFLLNQALPSSSLPMSVCIPIWTSSF